MDWSTYQEIRPLVDGGQTAQAVARLAELRAAAGPLPENLATLYGRALTAEGRAAEAAAVLREVIERGEAGYWTFRHLSEALRDCHDWGGVAEATRRSHALVDWPESLAHGYVFTHDYFSNNVPTWKPWFAKVITAAPIQALEIGSWQGGSACWLLDRIVGPRGGRLTCIDTFAGSSEHEPWLAAVTGEVGRGIEALFDANVARTGRALQMRKLVGTSGACLPTLAGEQFDFIYVDGAHEARYVIEDALLCWRLLRVGGCLLFDDATFTFADRPAQNTARAIKFFVSLFADELDVLADERQVLIRRTG